MVPLEAALRALRDEGFNALNVSGGDPLVYRPLDQLLATAKSLGFLTSFTTNGLLLSEKRLAELSPFAELISLSIDGMEQSHDRLRATPGAFHQLRQRLSLLRRVEKPFALLFTFDSETLKELPEVVGFAAESGARQLKINPLERTGRARESGLEPPTDLEISLAFVEAARLAEAHPKLPIHFDILDLALAAEDPAYVFAVADLEPDLLRSVPLATLVSPVIVEEDGAILPVGYGFDRSFALGQVGYDLDAQFTEFRSRRFPAFLQLARQTWSGLQDFEPHTPFTNWYARITEASRREVSVSAV